MSAATVLDVVIGIGVLVTAIVALFARERITAVSVFLALGVMLTVLWARLGAPDIALAEAAIASGVTGALLMAAVTGGRSRTRSSRTSSSRTRSSRTFLLASTAEILLGLSVAAALTAALVTASRTGADNAPVGRTLPIDDAAVSHPVTAVLLEFRSYDTLLEVAVLLAAAVAALSLHPTGMLDAVTSAFDRRPVFDVFVRALIPVVVLVVAWLLFAGSSRPGGAFQAGALMTGALLLLHLSGTTLIIGGRWLRPALVFGVAGFVAAALLTASFGAGWLALDDPWGEWVVLAVEAALTLSIGVSLAALFLAGQRPRRDQRPSRSAVR